MQIRIKGYTFEITTPYTSGQIITRGEAQALNNLRAENIQDNTRKLISKATEGLADGELLSAELLAELQKALTVYDLGYQFLEKAVPRPRLGDIELARREVAEELVDSQSRALGMEQAEEEREAAIALAERLPSVEEEARARVSARRAATSGSLEDL